MRQSRTHSTSNAISFLAIRSALSESKRFRIGGNCGLNKGEPLDFSFGRRQVHVTTPAHFNHRHHQPRLRRVAFTAAAHLPIVEALEARDAARAVAAMQHHLRTTWAGVHAMHRRAGVLEAASYAEEERQRPALSGSFQIGGDR
jgi:hypothetical protein